MTHEQAFSLNTKVERIINSETSSQSIVDAIPDNVLKELKTFAVEHLDLPNTLQTNNLIWYRKGGVHRSPKIQEFSNKYVKPFLKSNEILIGDTAFCINYPPHDVHVDNRDFRCEINKQNIIGTKSVVVPVEIDTTDYPKLYTANQYFYGPSTRMRKGCELLDSKDEEVQRQKDCGVYFSYDYKKDGVKYLEDKTVLSEQWYKDHIDEPLFVPYSTFEKLSIEAEHDWKPGNLIMFDSSRIHWAEKLTKRGATYKLGLSLNYGIMFKELD